jgi:hypothetical protein
MHLDWWRAGINCVYMKGEKNACFSLGACTYILEATDKASGMMRVGIGNEEAMSLQHDR